jgi:hypothetical protein
MRASLRFSLALVVLVSSLATALAGPVETRRKVVKILSGPECRVEYAKGFVRGYYGALDRLDELNRHKAKGFMDLQVKIRADKAFGKKLAQSIVGSVPDKAWEEILVSKDSIMNHPALGAAMFAVAREMAPELFPILRETGLLTRAEIQQARRNLGIKKAS